MTDQTTTIAELKRHVQDFADARGWRRGNGENAKNMVMALSVEVAELAEIFMWLHSDDAGGVKDDPETYQHVREELADIFWYLCRLCGHLDVDLAHAVAEKTHKNAEKYPVPENIK